MNDLDLSSIYASYERGQARFDTVPSCDGAGVALQLLHRNYEITSSRKIEQATFNNLALCYAIHLRPFVSNIFKPWQTYSCRPCGNV
jgi:hypothetical protein